MFVNTAWAAAFVVTVVVGRPAIAGFVRGLYGFPWSWLNDDRVRRAYAELTLIWSAFFAGKAAVYAAGQSPLERSSSSIL